MVLHNNKWDRRAKKKYLKKHNLTTDRAGHPQPAAAASIEETSSSESDSEIPRFEDAAITVENEFDEDPEHENEMKQLRELEKRIRSGRSAVPAPQSGHIQTGTSDLFERAQAGAARSQLNQRVNQISKKHSKIELDSDSEFEDFMDDFEPNAPPPPATAAILANRSKMVRKPLDKQDFVDQLIMK